MNTERMRETHLSSDIRRLTGEKEDKRSQLSELQKEGREIEEAVLKAREDTVERESQVAFLQKDIQDTEKELEKLRRNQQSFANNQINLSTGQSRRKEKNRKNLRGLSWRKQKNRSLRSWRQSRSSAADWEMREDPSRRSSP